MRREASTTGTTVAMPAEAESPRGCLWPHDSLAMAPGQTSVSTFPFGSPSPMFSLRPWRYVAEVTESRTLTSGDPRFLLFAGGEIKQCGRGGGLRIVSAEQGGQLVTSRYSRLVGGKPRASAMKTLATSCRRNVLELRECNHGEWEIFRKGHWYLAKAPPMPDANVWKVMEGASARGTGGPRLLASFHFLYVAK